MEPTLIPRVKVCCISSVEEARAAISHGASALGLVSEMPSGPGVIPEELISEIASAAPPGVSTFLLTSRQDAEGIVEQHRRCRTSAIQICDRLERGSYEALRAALPAVKLVQVVHVTGEESVKEALVAASRVDAILLDSGNQALKIKELGGTGRTHDWELSRRIREEASVPVFLAGGLNPGNIAEAIRQVGPFGVDLCSGVRTNNRLDEAKLSGFFDRIRNIQARS